MAECRWCDEKFWFFKLKSGLCVECSPTVLADIEALKVALDPAAPPSRLAMVASDAAIEVLVSAAGKKRRWAKLLAGGADPHRRTQGWRDPPLYPDPRGCRYRASVARSAQGQDRRRQPAPGREGAFRRGACGGYCRPQRRRCPLRRRRGRFPQGRRADGPGRPGNQAGAGKDEGTGPLYPGVRSVGPF